LAPAKVGLDLASNASCSSLTCFRLLQHGKSLNYTCITLISIIINVSNARYFNGIQISSVHLFFRASFLSVFLAKGIIVTERSAHQNYMASKWVSLSYTKSGGRGRKGREAYLVWSIVILNHLYELNYNSIIIFYELFFFVPNSFHEWWA